MRCTNGRARKRESEQTAGGKRGKILRETAIPNRGDAFKRTVLAGVREKENQLDVVVADQIFSGRSVFVSGARDVRGCLRVLDIRDCRALRRERARIVSLGSSGGSGDNSNAIERSINAKPEATDDDFAREISSIFRSDLTLVCSSAELELLLSGVRRTEGEIVFGAVFETIDTKSIITPFADEKMYSFRLERLITRQTSMG